MKRLALFGATVVFPCVLLVLFGYRMIRQDGELTARYAEDEGRKPGVPEQTGHTRMLLGRALLKAGDMEAAAKENRELLRPPFSLLDEQGVPFGWYAADRLLGMAPDVVRERFRGERFEATA